jgi:cyanophycinase
LDLISEIQRYNRKGVVIAGTSAGASILGEHMPYYSEEKEEVIYYRGLDLITNSMIDQHFSQRHRIKRLQDGVERFKGIIGYGIDEDTAIGFQNNKEIFRCGKGKILTIK